MRQARLKLFLKINAIDALLDNTLLPAVYALTLVAFIWSKFQ